MKKLICIVILCLIAAALYAMPPSPGSYPTHDGSQHPVLADTQPSMNRLKNARISQPKRIAPAPKSGDRNFLVLLANFTDLSFLPAHDAAYYKKKLETDPNHLTATKYYQDMSDNALNLSFTVLGPYNVANTRAYYGGNDPNKSNSDRHVGGLLAELLLMDSVKTDILACWNNSWDTNGDNYIDTVIVIFPGKAEEDIYNGQEPDAIWSSQWNLYSAAQFEDGYLISELYERLMTISAAYKTAKGKIFNNFLIVPEYKEKTREAEIGSLCHEFGHFLGLRDLYDTTYATAGTGCWSVMDVGAYGSNGNGGSTPGDDPMPLLAWEKYYLGWLTPTTITPSAEHQTFHFSDIEESREAWKINLTDDGSQYLLLEGKKANMSGTGKATLESGLLITHIHDGILNTYWYDDINNTKSRPHGINIVEAVSDNYDSTGLGSLWADSFSPMTTKACFRADTKTILKPYTAAVAYNRNPWTGIALIIGGTATVTSFILLQSRRKKLIALALAGCLMACAMACDNGSGSSGSYDDEEENNNGDIINPSGNGQNSTENEKFPNSNYYTSTTNIDSKTGISGIIITVDCPAGSSSGSFTVVKEE